MNLTVYLVLTIVALAIALAIVVYKRNELLKNLSTQKQKTTDDNQQVSVPLKLQAYERLTLLADRIALPNLIMRTGATDLSAKDLQLFLVQTIKQEFEYNITQQIYVSADAWNAIKNLKDQNILLIHQISKLIPDHASGNDFSRFLLEYLMNDKKGNLHEVVSEVISYEAKQII